MKKSLLILLMSVYAIAIFGIGISHFYCCGQLKFSSVTFIDQSSTTCAKGGQKDGCCKTETQIIKVKDTHIVGDMVTAPGKYFADLDEYISHIEVASLGNQPLSIANGTHAPPDNISVPVYILNCVYRI